MRRTVAAVLLLAAPAASRAEDIVIGMSAPFTGPSRALGRELYRGSMAWFSEVNQRGGIHGRKIVLKAYDDEYDPEATVLNTRKLILEDNARLLFGYVGTPTVARALPVLKLHEKRSVFLFCPFTGAETTRQGAFADRVFNLRASYRDETQGLVSQFLKLGRKRIAVFYQIDAYGRSGWDGVRRALAASGLKICGEATYKRGTRFRDSLTAQVEILKRSEPDAVICVGAYAASAAFIRDARDAGLAVPIANLSFVGSESLLRLLQRHGESGLTDYTRDLVNSQVVPCGDQVDLPGVKLYREMMAKHRPAVPDGLHDARNDDLPYSFTGLEGFLDARWVTAVLTKLGPGLDCENLPQVVAGMGTMDLGLASGVRFVPERRQASNKVYFTTVEKGAHVPLADWGRWKK
jgi:branched-chain amino acid transport system substrate-binding protein